MGASSDLLTFSIDESVSFAALKPEQRFLIYMDFMFPVTEGELLEDQYKQPTHTVNTHSNLAPHLTSLVFL